MSLLLAIIIGAVAGALASLFLRRDRGDMFTNAIIGIVGAVFGLAFDFFLLASDYSKVVSATGLVCSATGALITVFLFDVFHRVVPDKE